MNSRSGWMTVVLTGVLLTGTAHADVITKADNADALNLETSWTQGAVPGSNDVATWDAALTASKTYSLGEDLGWLGMALTADPGGNLAFNSGNTLTLGAAGYSSTVNRTVTFNCALDIGADQEWYVSTGLLIPAGPVNMNGHTLSFSGANTKQFKNLISGGGRLVNNGSGSIKFTNAGTAAPDTDVTLSAANLTIETSTGLANGPRMASLTLINNGSLTIGGRSSADTVETNAGALVVGPGYGKVTISPNSAKNAMFYSGTLDRAERSGGVVFVGTAIGQNTLASLATNSANALFGAAPSLLGAGGVYGSTTSSILPSVFCETNSAISTPGMGFATYDAEYGVRPLDLATEYTAAITDGQTQLDNVRYANASGSGVITASLSQDTTVNSLSLVVTGTTTDGGIVVTGETDRVLTVASGCIFASQTLSGTPNANDAQKIAVPFLNLNGREGVIFRRTASVSNGDEPACLNISSCITNDGGKGVTFVGPGLTYLSGSTLSAYTGPTVCQSGDLRISKSVANMGIPGDLLVAGGNVLNTGGQIPDGSDIYITGGRYYQKGAPLNSGTGATDTFRNLYMTGGSFTDGASGTSSGSTFLTNAVLSGGSWTVTYGHSSRVGETLTLCGGTIGIGRANDTTRNTTLTTAGLVTLSNLLSGVYSPVAMTAGSAAGINGGRWVIAGGVRFAGNPDNTNTLSITASTPPLAGCDAQIRLNDIQTFEVGDGAAASDVTLQPVLTDNGATAGGLIKTGAGTLTLTATNAYTAATTVSNGTLAVFGALTSPVTVCDGATFAGTGLVAAAGTAISIESGGSLAPGTLGTTGSLAITGDVSFASGARFSVDISNAASDLLTVSGNVSGGTVSVDVSGAASAPVMILKAAALQASFTMAAPGLSLSKRANDTELWLGKSQGTVIMLF